MFSLYHGRTKVDTIVFKQNWIRGLKVIIRTIFVVPSSSSSLLLFSFFNTPQMSCQKQRPEQWTENRVMFFRYHNFRVQKFSLIDFSRKFFGRSCLTSFVLLPPGYCFVEVVRRKLVGWGLLFEEGVRVKILQNIILHKN